MKRMSQDRNSGGFGPRLIRTRYAGSCSECRIALPAGSRATWHPRDKTLTCESCRHASVAVEASAPASAARMQLDDGAAESPEVRVVPDLPDGVADPPSGSTSGGEIGTRNRSEATIPESAGCSWPCPETPHRRRLGRRAPTASVAWGPALTP